jgi:hypothetical protein
MRIKLILILLVILSVTQSAFSMVAPISDIGGGDWNSCGPGNYHDTGGSASDYSNSESFTETYCSDIAGDCIQFTFSAFNTESCCDHLSIYDGTTTSDPLIGTFDGTTSPGTVTSSSGCLTFEWTSDGSIVDPGWEAAVSCVTCPTCTDGILNGQEVGIDCGGPTCPACPCASLPVSNDEACCATAVTVNADAICNSTTAGTVQNATASFNGSTCSGTDDDDVWFSFVALSTNHDIDILNVSGSVTDMYHAVYAGTCNSTGASLVCSDANSSSLSGLTVGNTYYIRVYTYTSTGGQNTTFDVCVTSPCGLDGPPSCGLNYTHSNIAYSPANYTTGTTITFSDDRFADAYTSIGFDFCYDGVIYQDVLVSSNGYIIFPSCHSAHPFGTKRGPSDYSPYSINAVAPNTTDAPVNAIMGTWQDIYPSSSAVDGVIRTRTNGISPNRRFVVKFYDVRMYSCTSQDYNGQIMLYETTENIEVHLGEKTVCSTFNSGAAIMGITDYTGTSAVIPGGYNYPTQWTATNEGHRWTNNCGACIILPVELIEFEGMNYEGKNVLTWKTATEINNDYFVLERSDGGSMFYEVATIPGGGNSNVLLEYSYTHHNPNEIEYYRLRQVDFDGKWAYSKIIAIRKQKEIDVKIYPNPAKGNLFFEISKSSEETYTIVYTNILGSTHKEKIQISNGTNTYQVNDFSNLTSGIYFIQILNENNEVIKTQKIVKE